MDFVDWIHDDAPFSLIAPDGLRGDAFSGAVESFVMALSVLPASGGTEVPAEYVVNAADFFPTRRFDTEGLQPGTYSNIIPGPSPDGADEYFPNGEIASDTKVLVVFGGRSPEDVFGIPAEEMPGERVEGGEASARATANNPFIVAGPGLVAEEIPPSLWDSTDFSDIAVPTWMGGPTYGLGGLSTPAAKVAGQSVNPVAGMSFEELLTSEQASGLLGQAGGITADSVDWLAGPSQTDFVAGLSQTDFLGQETELESFLGVVSGENGPSGVMVHMARVENEHVDGTDIVVIAAVNRWPVESADYVDWIDGGAGERFSGILGSILGKARTLTAAAGRDSNRYRESIRRFLKGVELSGDSSEPNELKMFPRITHRVCS